ncbi:helix-turn-helix transcriptional regulator (plasmid) [Lactococcus lactis subsp. lactis]|uniref:helix-turn-helix domain-containing protein n=1 Tax=Lactococcus lactis TaxID=1358 RepID=UPI002649059F|nr:helix-turn-helix transcriptional regulator [Lactococcus lactis]WKB49920.1 helix-turn-helix transcriptional regulator [Lactococcus lactis subsp. lactis]
MELSEKLKQLRADKKITQEKLAEILYVSRPTISSWENGRSYPDLQMIVAICDYFEISLDFLLREDKKMIKKLSFDMKNKQRFKVLIISLIVIVFGLVALIWNNQIKAMNPQKIQIVKVEKVTIAPRVIDGIKIGKDYKYYVYVKMNDPLHTFEDNTSSNGYDNEKNAVYAEFYVRNSFNIFSNLKKNQKLTRLTIHSGVAQELVNGRKGTYNIHKNIFLTDGGSNKKLIIDVENNK